MKKRILIANDASFLDTGYGIYGKELLTRLHNSKKYEIAELGCYAEKDNPKIKSIPWRFYPNAVNINDPRIEQYKSNNINQFGLWRFNRVLADFRPHIVFDVRDYWMYSYQEVSPYKKYFHWIIMPTTDSAPPKIEWLYTFANADIIVPYTKWAYNVLQKNCGKNINLFPKIANAGINANEFFPIENKKEHQKKYFGKEVSVIGVVMRNQRRKLFADLMLAYRKYLDKLKNSNQVDLYNKSYLYLHTSFPEDNGWDIPALLIEHNLLDKTYFSYSCHKCKKFFPAKFQSSLAHCKYCSHKTATITSPNNGVSTHELNEIYNLFDLFIQYAICEGFGMPQVEAAACGLQIASVDYSAMTEITENVNGFKIPLKTLFREMETNANRAFPDNDATSEIMFNYMNTYNNLSDKQKTINSTSIREKCLETYTWDKVYGVWEECFDSINIKDKTSWDDPKPSTTNHTSIRVPQDLDVNDFVTYICTNVINEPSLLKTAHIQCLIRDTLNGIIARNGAISSMSKQQLVEILEGHMNNKIVCEKMRTQPKLLSKEDFIP